MTGFCSHSRGINCWFWCPWVLCNRYHSMCRWLVWMRPASGVVKRCSRRGRSAPTSHQLHFAANQEIQNYCCTSRTLHLWYQCFVNMGCRPFQLVFFIYFIFRVNIQYTSTARYRCLDNSSTSVVQASIACCTNTVNADLQTHHHRSFIRLAYIRTSGPYTPYIRRMYAYIYDIPVYSYIKTPKKV